MAEQVKDMTLSLLWLCLQLAQLWHGLDPWPRNFHMLQARPNKKKKKKKKEEGLKLEHHTYMNRNEEDRNFGRFGG